MQAFIGTKLILAQAMNRADYNEYRGWDLPGDEDGTDAGFLVEYVDGGEANDERHMGYISWSPATVFMNSYQPTDRMNFGHAIEMLKAGKKVARPGWNGKGMFLFLVPGSTFQVNRAPLLGIYPEGHTVKYQSHIDMKTANDTVVPWLSSQSDMLAEDWCIVE
jgi:hypothetical protein